MIVEPRASLPGPQGGERGRHQAPTDAGAPGYPVGRQKWLGDHTATSRLAEKGPQLERPGSSQAWTLLLERSRQPAGSAGRPVGGGVAFIPEHIWKCLTRSTVQMAEADLPEVAGSCVQRTPTALQAKPGGPACNSKAACATTSSQESRHQPCPVAELLLASRISIP